MFNVSSINLCTEVEGPFRRVAIWFQGCLKCCEGCCNQELQALKPANMISMDQLFDIIQSAKQKFSIEGVTFLGGEPTLQKELPELCSRLNKENIGIILFTGYSVAEIDNKYKNCCDIIIDGEFVNTKLDDKRNMIGSTNQKIYCLTKRYENNLSWFLEKREKKVEINFNEELFFNGDVLKF